MTLHPVATFGPIAAAQHGAIGRSQLADLGFTREGVRHLVQRGVVRPVSRDVFVVAGHPSTWWQQIWVALLDAGPRAVASHRTAAKLHGLPGFDGCRVDTLLPERHSHRSTSTPFHASSLLPVDHLTSRDGVPTTTVARTIFDLAGLSSPLRLRAGQSFVHADKVERTLDTALNRGLDIDELHLVIADLGTRGRPGTALMRRLLGERGDGYAATESDLEDLLISVLQAHGLPLPERQVALGDDDRPIGRVDFTYREAQLVIEADGRKYHRSLIDSTSDRWRDIELVSEGLRVARVTWRDLKRRPDEFAARIARALATGPRGTGPADAPAN